MARSVVSACAKIPRTFTGASLVVGGMTVSHRMSERLLDLDDGERRHHADEGEEQDEEPGERPHDDGAVRDRRIVRAPGVRVEVVPEAGDDDVEALEPHADEHEDGDDV